MRIIEFRAKDFLGIWRYGDLITSNDEFYGIEHNKLYSDVDEATIGQYTGMRDRNDKKIYEGDVVLHKGYSGKKEPMLVRFDCGAFIVGFHKGSSTKETPMLLNRQCELIGNIYDNPELIKNFQDEKGK